MGDMSRVAQAMYRAEAIAKVPQAFVRDAYPRAEERLGDSPPPLDEFVEAPMPPLDEFANASMPPLDEFANASMPPLDEFVEASMPALDEFANASTLDRFVDAPMPPLDKDEYARFADDLHALVGGPASNARLRSVTEPPPARRGDESS
jgi:hypothetical protein